MEIDIYAPTGDADGEIDWSVAVVSRRANYLSFSLFSLRVMRAKLPKPLAQLTPSLPLALRRLRQPLASSGSSPSSGSAALPANRSFHECSAKGLSGSHATGREGRGPSAAVLGLAHSARSCRSGGEPYISSPSTGWPTNPSCQSIVQARSSPREGAPQASVGQ